MKEAEVALAEHSRDCDPKVMQTMKLYVQCILAGATPHLLANKLQREMTSEGIFPAVKESSGAVGSLN